MPPTRVPRCGALVVVVAVLAHRVPRLRRGRVPASAPASGVRVVDVPASREPWRPRPSRACGRARAPRAAPPPTEPRPRTSSRVLAPHERCPRRPRPSSRVLVARVPRPRRERCGGRARDERVVCSCRACRGWPWPCARAERAGVLASREPCSRPACRARRPSAVCSRRGSGRGRARDERAALPPLEPPCPRRACRGRGARRPSAAPPTSERPCSRTACRRGVLVSREPPCSRRASGRRVPVVRVRPCSSSECGGGRARVDRAVCSRRTSRGCVLVARERPRLRRERRRHDAVVCSCRASGVPASMEPPWCARVERAAAPELSVRRCGARVERAVVLALRVPRPCASDEGAAVPSTRERYAGAVGAVSEWWTCLRRACRIDR